MEDKKELLMAYVNTNVAPILVDFISSKNINGAIILPSTIDLAELNGHYEETKHMPPQWYSELISKKYKVIVIDLIDEIKKEEQLKFIELLKYRKISTFELPENCVIIVTAKEINKDKINEDVYSLLAHI